MQPLAVHHVSINVDDVEIAQRFYVDVLGLTPRTDRPDFGFPGAWLNAGDQQLHLIGGKVPSNEGQHFAVGVADIGATIAELRGNGVSVSEPSPVNAGWQAFLVDPCGNTVELFQG
jgi:catechol 2,3-dioxygenase-like lactoylglutathione lyase family enzyme